jgi:flagellar basal body-associated protein FliL
MANQDKKTNLLIPVISGIVAIIIAAAFVLYKIGQHSANAEKWADYDDFGWS